MLMSEGTVEVELEREPRRHRREERNRAKLSLQRIKSMVRL